MLEWRQPVRPKYQHVDDGGNGLRSGEEGRLIPQNWISFGDLGSHGARLSPRTARVSGTVAQKQKTRENESAHQTVSERTQALGENRGDASHHTTKIISTQRDSRYRRDQNAQRRMTQGGGRWTTDER